MCLHVSLTQRLQSVEHWQELGATRGENGRGKCQVVLCTSCGDSCFPSNLGTLELQQAPIFSDGTNLVAPTEHLIFAWPSFSSFSALLLLSAGFVSLASPYQPPCIHCRALTQL